MRLTDSAHVVVQALSRSALFTSGARIALVIDDRAGLGTFEIQIPRSAPHVEIVVSGTRRFLKEGDHVAANGPAQTGAVYLFPCAKAAAS